MKILIICGHGSSDPGACSQFGQEAKETRRVGNRVAELLKPYAEVVMYPQSHNAYSDVCNGNFAASLGGVDYVFEIHFNSASANARGTEVWVVPTESSTSVEQKIVNNLASCNFINRGVKKEFFAVISHCKNRGVSSALVETCFISNKEDMNTYNAKFNQVCEAMAKGIVEGFGISYKSTTTVEVKEENKYYNGDDDMFSENYYLTRYPDVKKAIEKGVYKSAYDHYIQRGKLDKPNRQPLPPVPVEFCEGEYLECNPDVAKAVKEGKFTSGLHHYLLWGWNPNEKRKVCKSDNDEALKKRIKELEDKIEKAKEELK